MTTAAYRENIKGIVWNHQKPAMTRRDRAGRTSPHYISDHMDTTWHPATGDMIDSKSRFREVTKAHGCIEVGNDVQMPKRPVRPESVAPDVRRAIEQLRSR